jgi:hypothetical protein
LNDYFLESNRCLFNTSFNWFGRKFIERELDISISQLLYNLEGNIEIEVLKSFLNYEVCMRILDELNAIDSNLLNDHFLGSLILSVFDQFLQEASSMLVNSNRVELRYNRH